MLNSGSDIFRFVLLREVRDHDFEFHHYSCSFGFCHLVDIWIVYGFPFPFVVLCLYVTILIAVCLCVYLCILDYPRRYFLLIADKWIGIMLSLGFSIRDKVPLFGILVFVWYLSGTGPVFISLYHMHFILLLLMLLFSCWLILTW